MTFLKFFVVPVEPIMRRIFVHIFTSWVSYVHILLFLYISIYLNFAFSRNFEVFLFYFKIIYNLESWRKKINSFNGGKKRIKSKEVDINSQKKAYVPSLTVAILEQCCMENGLIASESATTSDKKFSQKINNNIKNDASLVTRKYQLSIENVSCTIFLKIVFNFFY